MTFDFPAAGSYYMVLDFFENAGGEEIEFFQTDSGGGNQRLINVDSELIVFRDDVTRIEATNVVIVDGNTISCQVDLTSAEPNEWNVVVTPECGEAAEGVLENGLQIVLCSSDFNRDSKVDLLDHSKLADKWKKPCSAPLWCNGIDIDHNGYVDAGDLAVLAEEWLTGSP